MAVVEELIRKESNGTLSFGNFTLDKKAKRSDFEFEGDLYKVKTFKEITKLERNGMFIYESVPGTSVYGFKNTENELEMNVEGFEDAQITLELEPKTEYKVSINNVTMEEMKTNLGGKIVLSIELNPLQQVGIKVAKS